jgi:hypothetical protein
MEHPMNYAAIDRTRLGTDPFRWGVVHGLIERERHRRLADEFPTVGFERMRRREGSDKRYEAWFRAVKDPTAPEDLTGLGPAWVELVAELGSAEYRGSLGRCLGVALDDHLLEITLWRYGAAHFLGPHTDIETKRVAHLMYFNEAWDPTWGGCLRILRSRNIDDVVREIPPTFDESVILVRSNDSWHGVSEVTVAAVAERKVLQVSFWKEPPRQGPDLPGLEVLEAR